MADPSNPDQTDEIPPEDSGVEATAATETQDAAEPAAGAPGSDAQSSTTEIEQRLDDATESLEQAAGDGVSTEAEAKPYNLGNLSPVASGSDKQPIDLIGEVEMDLRIELGRTQMRLEEVLHLRGGSVVALDKLAGDPVDVFANGRLIARGEVLVMNDNFCIRVTELVGA
jgi:flagellar motor switch protein FliN/FliY